MQRGLQQQDGRGGGAGVRVEEDHAPRPLGRPGLNDRLHFQAGELAAEFGRIAHRGRAEHEGRVRAVVAAHAPQPPEDHGHVRAEHPAVGVHFVEDHVAQAGPELRPGVVVGQHGEVDHLGVGQDDVGRVLADFAPEVGRGVAVVDGRGEGDVSGPLVEHAELVLGQGLEGEDVQGAGPGVGQHGLQHGQGVGQCLAAGRGRGRDHVPSGAQQVQGPGLMGIELRDALALQDLEQGGGQGPAGILQPRLTAGQQPVVGDLALEALGVQEGLDVVVDGVGQGIVRTGQRVSHMDDLFHKISACRA